MTRLHLLPAGRAIAEPVVLSEALSRASHGRPSADFSVYVRDGGTGDGDILIKHPWANNDEAKTALAAYISALPIITRGLRDGVLHTFVRRPSDGDYLRIDRRYWFSNGVNVDELQEFDASGWDDSMKGAPIVVALADLPSWRELLLANSSNLSLANPAEQSSETETMPRSASRGGWKVTQSYEADLRRLFSLRHDEFSNETTNAGMLRLVHRLWPLLKTTTIPPNDTRTIARRWKEHVEQQ